MNKHPQEEPAQPGRRRLLSGTGGLMALSAFPLQLSASQREQWDAHLSLIAQRRGLVLYRDNNGVSRAFADSLQRAGLEVSAVSEDPVRQWRQALEQAFLVDGRPLLGLTNWADFLIYRGLAAEHRRHPAISFEHSIDPDVDQNWSQEYAGDLLAVSRQAEFLAVPNHMPRRGVHSGRQYSLFSWLIL